MGQLEKYEELKEELEKMKMVAKVIPVVIEALGTVVSNRYR